MILASHFQILFKAKIAIWMRGIAMAWQGLLSLRLLKLRVQLAVM